MYVSKILLLAVLLAFPGAAAAQTLCVDGEAGDFSCEGVDLLAHLPQAELGFPGAGGNDIWGWTDPDTGKEYALMGLTAGTAFVDVTSPTEPVLIGTLLTASSSSSWRDIKTVGNYAYIVSDINGDHGVQVFDLTRLEDVTNPPVEFDMDAHYTGVGSSHNIVALEEAEIVIPVGSDQCSAGLEILDVSDPLNPTQVGCYADQQNAYVHDAQCVRYDGPDTEHAGKDLCYTASEDFAAIVDITDPANPELITRMFYPSTSYTHQGWLTEDQAWFVVNDETDLGTTRTMFFDVSDLETADFAYTRLGPTQSTDHNLYIRDGYMHQTNYRVGYRLWDIRTPESEESVNEIAWFDTYPEDDDHGFGGGTWSNYPFFESGIVIVSSIDRGLFVLDPNPPAVASFMEFSVPEAGPGDGVTLSATIFNRGDGDAPGTTFSTPLPEGLTFDGNLVTSAGTASEENGTVTWTLDVGAGAPETISFDVLIDEAAPTGILENTAFVTLPDGEPYELSASIFIDVEPDLTFTATPNAEVPAGGYPGECAVSELEVSDSFSFEQVRLGVTAEHTWREDLVVSLESPDGTSAFLLDHVGGSTDNLDALIMDDGLDSAFDYGDHDVAAPFYEVRGVPDQGSSGEESLGALSDFAGANTQGTWSLSVCDDALQDSGTLLRWSLLFYGVTVADEASPNEIADMLSAPKPNPVQRSASLTLRVAEAQDVVVEVFDVTGRRLKTLYDGALPAGTSETLTLDTSTLPAGVYVIRATGEDVTKTRRVTVVR